MGMIGNSLAQGLISGANIQDGTVDTPDIKDSAVTAAKIASAVVTPAKMDFSAGTANGVLYLNGSKVASSGSGLTFNSSGFLGIGQTSPTYSVDILADTGTLLVHQTRARVIDQERYIGGITGGGYSTGTTIVDAAQIVFSSTGAWTSTSTPSHIAFGTTASGSTTLTERARIDSSGQFGIGTTPSSSMLHIKGNWVSGHSTVKAQTFTAMSSGGVAGYGVYDSDGTRQWYLSADSTTANWWVQVAKPIVFATNDVERARIDSSGNLLLKKSSVDVATNGMQFVAVYNGASYWSSNIDNTYHVYNTSTSQYNFYVSNSGVVYYRTLSQLSDEREKENIVGIDRGLAEVLSLRPVKFDWKTGESTNNAGFIAQEVQAVLPEFVDEAKIDEEGNMRLRLSTSEFIPVLVKAIQEQQAIIEQMQTRLAALEGA